MHDKKIYAGIISYNPDIKRLEENVNALISQVERIIIFDNGSQNQEFINKSINKYYDIKFFYSKKNVGIAAALNILMEWGLNHGYEWMLSLDQDSVCSPDFINNMLPYLKTKSDIGIVAPVIIDRNIGVVGHKPSHDHILVNTCITSGAITRIGAWNSIGRYDESMFIDSVDFEFCYRMRKKGYKIIQIRSVQLLHELGNSNKKRFLLFKVKVIEHSAFRKFYIARNNVYYPLKHHLWIYFIRGNFRNLWLLILILLYESMKKEKVKSLFCGWKEGICSLGKNNMKKKCMIIISHSNYMIKSAGVEKSLKEICELLSHKKISNIHIFPIIEINKKLKSIKKKYIGINFNGKFYGTFNMENIPDILFKLKEKYNLHYLGIQLHHLHGWDLKILSSVLKQLNIPIKFYIHDYGTICEHFYIDDGNGEQCRTIIELPNEKKCKNCKYGTYNIKWSNLCLRFFASIKDLLLEVVAPSESALQNWLDIYNEFVDISVIRGHLEFKGQYKKSSKNSKIRLAYVGSMTHHKGYEEWKYLIEKIPVDNYELFYFGNQRSDQKRVQDIFVDFQKKGIKMEEALRKHNIDLVFLWSTCYETYSYTCYEAYAAGCLILTNLKSGNIAYIVEKYKAGKLFKNIESCHEYLNDFQKVHADVQNYYSENVFPEKLLSNQNMDHLLFDQIEQTDYIMTSKKKQYGKCIYLSLLYKILRVRY